MLGEFELAKFAGEGDKSLAVFGKELINSFIERNAIKHQYVAGKGRSLVAAGDIQQNKLLIIDQPLNYKFTKEECSSTALFKLAYKLIHRAKQDGLLAKKLLLLEYSRATIHKDSDEHDLPLIDDLHWMGYRSFSFQIPPFLPQTPLQVGVDSEVLTLERVLGVLDTNTFVINDIEEHNSMTIHLMLRTSLLNHSNKPNCTKVNSGSGEAMLFSSTFIKKGEELFIDYGEGYWKARGFSVIC